MRYRADLLVFVDAEAEDSIEIGPRISTSTKVAERGSLQEQGRMTGSIKVERSSCPDRWVLGVSLWTLFLPTCFQHQFPSLRLNPCLRTLEAKSTPLHVGNELVQYVHCNCPE